MPKNIETQDMLVDDLLESKDLLKRIVKEIQKKVAGESDTIEAIFLHFFCAWVKNTTSLPHIFVNSESSAGKSYLCKQITNIFPKGIVEYRTKITPEAFTYWHNSKFEPDWDWDGKICYLEDVKDEIINSSTFKVMASEGSTATVVIKQKAIDVEIKGSPIIVVTSASAEPTSEVLNRFSIINLDETKEQSKRIMRKQIQEAIMGKYEEYDPIFPQAVSELMRLEVRLPEWLINISDYFPDDILRVRRDFPRFLDLMKASAVLHQKQREFDPLVKLVWANEQDYMIARNVIKKLDTSGGVFGLTHRQRKCYEKCVDFFKAHEESFNHRDMYSFHPFISDKQWSRVLKQLAHFGLLAVSIKKNEETGRNITVYQPKNFISITLPKVEDIKSVKDIKKNKDKKDKKDIKDTSK